MKLKVFDVLHDRLINYVEINIDINPDASITSTTHIVHNNHRSLSLTSLHRVRVIFVKKTHLPHRYFDDCERFPK